MKNAAEAISLKRSLVCSFCGCACFLCSFRMKGKIAAPKQTHTHTHVIHIGMQTHLLQHVFRMLTEFWALVATNMRWLNNGNEAHLFTGRIHVCRCVCLSLSLAVICVSDFSSSSPSIFLSLCCCWQWWCVCTREYREIFRWVCPFSFYLKMTNLKDNENVNESKWKKKKKKIELWLVNLFHNVNYSGAEMA